MYENILELQIKKLIILILMEHQLLWETYELKAVGEVFSDYKPKISKPSLAGHSLGATSVHEAIMV